MPEGPEVWFLSKAINCFYCNDNTESFGKHLIIKNTKENWSFGLNGKIEIDLSNKLHRPERKMRHMDIYQKGSKFSVLGRNWWI